MLANPHIHFVESRHGGHCAFLARRSSGVHWAEATVVRYLQAVSADTPAPAAPRALFASQLQ
jgi:predicted alpha/beta-fold hydrolase